MTKRYEENGVIAHIASLSSAEDIFTYLLLPYEQGVLNVSRLHIMKRMGQYLRGTDFSGYDEEEIFLATRQHLKRAYTDFVDSTPLKEKVFKVFTDKAAEHAARFVSIDQIGLAAK
ncbi:nitrogenase stabilizing/protective protein NifW [Tropicimonas isoalkanivorans]|uniref:Nitrogenase-stabilizing/protective protein NifW n=1 Tax=Tropicimonas isoalkanivorans TaxID=441112 RepID=A0A1I1H7Q0_9RHOB|nr:nitrogenase stabilizing/protective protein NifW [Tropicimonas isoalkanivorans]SFC19612.1 nitrogenase-stabilizing/protective protein [Tropicimonas isoalkanivorans]